MSDDTIESILGLHRELQRREREAIATPEEARRANTELRLKMRERRQLPARDREARREAAQVRRARLGRPHPPHRQHHGRAARLRAHLRQRPAALGPLGDRPRARPHLPAARRRSPAVTACGRWRCRRWRTGCSATSGPPTTPTSCSSGSRSTTTPRAASCPRRRRSRSCSRRRRTATSPSRTSATRSASTHEAAGMRLTNLATRHLDIPLHFLRVDGSGAITRVYENDDLPLPMDVTGAVDGQIACRKWSARVGLRRAEPHDRALPVHRHPGRHLLVLDADGHDVGRRVLDHRRRAVRRREVVPRTRDAEARDLDLPRRVVLPPRRRATSPSAGRARPGRARACTCRCSRRSPAAPSPASTTTRSTSSSTGTRERGRATR